MPIFTVEVKFSKWDVTLCVQSEERTAELGAHFRNKAAKCYTKSTQQISC